MSHGLVSGWQDSRFLVFLIIRESCHPDVFGEGSGRAHKLTVDPVLTRPLPHQRHKSMTTAADRKRPREWSGGRLVTIHCVSPCSWQPWFLLLAGEFSSRSGVVYVSERQHH